MKPKLGRIIEENDNRVVWTSYNKLTQIFFDKVFNRIIILHNNSIVKHKIDEEITDDVIEEWIEKVTSQVSN